MRSGRRRAPTQAHMDKVSAKTEESIQAVGSLVCVCGHSRDRHFCGGAVCEDPACSCLIFAEVPSPRAVAAQKLIEAARLITEAKAALDLSSSRCDGCAREHFANFNDKTRADLLDGALNRVLRVANALSPEGVTEDA